MSVHYQAVFWNRDKRVYDTVLGGGVLLYLALFLGLGFVLHPNATAETLLIRAFGTLALLLLHIVLSIGPLCRLDRRFLPLLYNRRHLGVTMFLIAAVHGVFSTVQFHALGDVNPLVSLLTSNTRFDSLSQFPFQILGFFGLLILFLMAATSHDFWLKTLTPRVWKTLHMSVYAAYAVLIAHVSLGALQSETSWIYAALLDVGVVGVVALHIAAGLAERPAEGALGGDGFVDVCAVGEIEDGRAKVVTLGVERVAVFRHGDRICAVSNVCAHQNGPLGEGRIIDGCITCPWHGYQYLPETGTSPPPFTEKVPVYQARVMDGRVLVDPSPLPEGTMAEPGRIE